MSVRIPDMPNLGAPTDDTLFVGDHSGSGTFNGAALRNYVLTSSPGALTVDDLHVTGIAQIDGGLEASTLHATGDAEIDGNLVVVGATTSGSTHSTGNGQIDGTLGVTGIATVGGLGVVGNAQIDGGLSVTGPIHTFGGIDVDGALIVNGGAQVDGNLNVTSSILVYGGAGHTIGTYGPDGYLILNGKDFSAGAAGAASLIINGGGRTPYCFEFYINGTRLMAFDGAGGAFKPGGGTWADISDARIKTDVTDYAAGLAEIVQLRPVSYKFVPETGRGTKVHYGLIAQEVETVMPEMVTQMSATVGDVEYSDMRSLDTSALIYALVSAVKELSTRVVALEGGAATRATVSA